MAIVPVHIVDAFADTPFCGNPAAIIPNAASLTEVEMLQITDELSMEAGFVLPPGTPGAVAYPVLRHRIITNFNAEAEGIKPDEIIRQLIEQIPTTDTGAVEKAGVAGAFKD